MAVRFRLGAPTMIRFLLLILFFVVVVPVHAIYDPLSVPNNRFGVHIADFSDIADVAPLVNSTGGDWGYVTLVASDRDRDPRRWQEMFNKMRRLHLIPLVRLATHVEKDYWVKPNPGNFDELVSFFNSLNWPAKNRYIILYNEPNHAKEWGGEIDPEGYASALVELGKKFRTASEDFFVLPAGLDVSAASDEQSLDAGEYLRRMISAQPELLMVIDGWTSHSYPNPGFSGSPFAVGRGTLRSYAWELGLLQTLGLTRTLPVFITETGWERGLLSSEAIGTYMLTAAQGAWSDPRIVAITPFVFNYQDVPFDRFSWKRFASEGGYYPQYESYRLITKSTGEPLQKERYILIDTLLPPALVANGTYTLKAQIQNNGQGILSENGYEVVLESDGAFTLLSDPLPSLEPEEKGELTIHIKAPTATGTYRAALSFKRYDRLIPFQTQDIEIVPPPALIVNANLGWRRVSEGSDVTVLVYDDAKLLHTFTGLTIKNGSVHVEGLSNILPGYPYRIVLLVPYYLPRQTIKPLGARETTVVMKRLLPLDFNRDGALTTKDLFAMISLKPNFIFSLFVGQ